MATHDCSVNRVDNLDGKMKSQSVTPQKVRELLNGGIASDVDRHNCAEGGETQVASNSNAQIPCEAVSKEAFFSRVESYSCLKWAGKPKALSPLRCARYGWVNIDSDMLKCSSCQAFLCASLQPSPDLQKYEERLTELTDSLKTQHEKFCFWPDFPCPERFWRVPLREPRELVSGFLQRFKSSCLLQFQLPAMKPENLKSMTLSEDVIGVLLQLLEDELAKEGSSTAKRVADALPVQVAACIVALCGWSASTPALDSLHLPILTCFYCQRKVGLWSLHQIEGVTVDGNGTLDSPSNLLSGQENRGDRVTPTTPTTPTRMRLRSQDMRTLGPEQPEANLSPGVVRTRIRDSPSPSEEMSSPLLRGKRPVTRSRVQGETPAGELPPSPQCKAKRRRLSSTSSQEAPVQKRAFDPVAQHRHWCPWVSVEEGDDDLETQPAEVQSPPSSTQHHQQGWRAALTLFSSMKNGLGSKGTSLSQGLHDKSKRVFKIFRQWQLSSSCE